MIKCTKCGSYATNIGRDGRDYVTDIDLCDVCYWKKRAYEAEAKINKLTSQEDLAMRQFPWVSPCV